MKLKTEISIVLVAKSLLFLIVCSLVYFFKVQGALIKQNKEHLESLSQAKKDRIAEIVHVRLEDVNLIASGAVLLQNLQKYRKTKNTENLEKIEIYFQQVLPRFNHLRNIYLLDRKGKVISSTDHAIQGHDFSGHEMFRHALLGESCMHEFSKNRKGGFSHFISIRVLEDNLPAGVVIGESSAEDIFSVCTDYTGLGKSGETVLVKKNPNKDLIYLSPLRFEKNAPLIKTLPAADNKEFIQTIFSSKSAFFEDIKDYRGENVLMSTRYLDRLGWVVMTKLDTSEAFITVRNIRDLTIVIGLITTVLLIISSYLMAAWIVKPIKSITKTATKISNGNLAKRVKEDRRNELGNLAKAFNKMTESLTDTQKNLQAKVKELDEVNDSLNRFAYIVSHDLKAPLISIESLTQMIMEDKELSEEERYKMIGMINTKVKGMQELIYAILQYSKHSGNDHSIKPVDLNEIVNQALENVLPPKNITIKRDRPLPTVIMDHIAALQVFQNLLSNAVKYMDKPAGEICIGCDADSNCYKFFVSDNGCGIHPENFDRVFQIFETAGKKEGRENTGVGLAIVKKIIEKAGGKIWVESEPGKGSTFYFTLPDRNFLVSQKPQEK